jgi:flagellar hook-associated protein 2
MSSSVASSINLSALGLGTGMNNGSLVTQLVAIASAPLTALQSTARTISSAAASLGAFSASLGALQGVAKGLADPAQYNAYAASSTATEVVATTAPGATAGVHTVSVSRVAQAQTTYSDPQASSSSPLGLTGTLVLSVGATSVTLDVTASESLADVAAAIRTSGAPVTASVVFDGTQYRLDLQGTQTGAANAVSLAETGFSLGLANPANTYQSAQDAVATVDGISITSPTNRVSGAIPGVTLAFTAPTAGVATVTVVASSGTLATQLASFVTAYNAVVAAGHADVGYGTTKPSNSLLAGDLGIRSTLSRLSGLMAHAVAGADSTLATVASIGLDLTSDGSLTLDTARLATAIQTDPVGVERLVVTSVAQGMTGLMGAISDVVDSVNGGASSVLKAEAQFYAGRTKAVAKQEAAMQARVDAYKTRLQTQFTSADMKVNGQRTLWGALGGTGTFM